MDATSHFLYQKSAHKGYGMSEAQHRLEEYASYIKILINEVIAITRQSKFSHLFKSESFDEKVNIIGHKVS